MEKHYEAIIPFGENSDDTIFTIEVEAESTKEAYDKIKKTKYGQFLESEDNIFEVYIRLYVGQHTK